MNDSTLEGEDQVNDLNQIRLLAGTIEDFARLRHGLAATVTWGELVEALDQAADRTAEDIEIATRD